MLARAVLFIIILTLLLLLCNTYCPGAKDLVSIKKAPEGASAGYADPAARYFVPDLKIRLITCPIRYQLWLQQYLNVLQ